MSTNIDNIRLIEMIGNRKWILTENGRKALKEWTLVTPEMLASFEKTEVAYEISEAPIEISNMIHELYDNDLLHKERSTYNLWAPSPDKIENLRRILKYSCERVTRVELSYDFALYMYFLYSDKKSLDHHHFLSTDCSIYFTFRNLPNVYGCYDSYM